MADDKHEFSRLAESLIGDFRGIPDQTPHGQRRRPTLHAKESIARLLVKHRIGQEGPEDTIRHAWADLVGAANAHYSNPVSIDGSGKLLVMVAHAVVKNELFHNRKQIAERIRALPGCGAVQSILLKVG